MCVGCTIPNQGLARKKFHTLSSAPRAHSLWDCRAPEEAGGWAVKRPNREGLLEKAWEPCLGRVKAGREENREHAQAVGLWMI